MVEFYHKEFIRRHFGVSVNYTRSNRYKLMSCYKVNKLSHLPRSAGASLGDQSLSEMYFSDHGQSPLSRGLRALNQSSPEGLDPIKDFLTKQAGLNSSDVEEATRHMINGNRSSIENAVDQAANNIGIAPNKFRVFLRDQQVEGFN